MMKKLWFLMVWLFGLLFGGMTFAQQYIVFSDDFNRADSPSIGSGWVDQAGNVGSIVSNKLQILNTQQQGYNLNRIARPTHEAHLDVEVSAEFSFWINSRISGIETRIQDNDTTSPNAYYTLLNWDNTNALILGKITNGIPSNIAPNEILNPAVDTGHVYRITLSVTGTSPTTLIATAYDITAGQIVATISGTDDTAILQNPGTVGFFNNDVGRSVFIDNFLYTTTDEENVIGEATGVIIPISNTTIVVSPYTWYSGTDYKQINAAGGYIKVAFNGSHLGVGVDTSKLASISPSNVLLRAYIDGSTIPISKTLANVNSGEVVFNDSLASGNHYAIIYGWFSNISNSRRSGNPPASLMIKSVILSTGSEVKPLTGTLIAPSDKKIIFYGDSITEGSLVSVAEKGYAPTLGKYLGIEYGQLGYGGGRWNTVHPSWVPAFYTNNITDNRRNYSENKSRLDNNKYLDGTPTAIFNNYGINDARGDTGAPTMRSAVTGWLGAARVASSIGTEIYMIVPFNYGNGSYNTYKTAFIGGYQDYLDSNPDDTRVYLIDLGVKAWDAVDNNSTDDLHPNDTGSAILAGLIKDALTPLVIKNLTGTVDSDTGVSLTWEYPDPDTNNIRHINTDYLVEYQTSGTSMWTMYTILPGVVTGVQITGLSAGTEYNFRITSLNTLLPDEKPNADVSLKTTGTAPVPSVPTNPTSPSWWGGGGGGSASKDYCPNGDFSPSYYDGTCGVSHSEQGEAEVKNPENSQQPVDSSLQPSVSTQNDLTDEILTAYQRAYSHDITTLAPLANATPDWTVIRGHLAKMVTNYALNALWRTLPEKVPAQCHRKDGSNAWESAEIKDYAVKACSLGLMGMDMDYFQPLLVVTRAQFGTVLSRLLRQNAYAGGKPYYAKHLEALKENWIMTQIDNPESRVELRKRVRLMLMRSAK